jgi:hypothetical protein
MAMKACHPKVLKVKPPGNFGSPLEAFSFGGDPMPAEEFKRKFTAILDALVKG